MNITRFRNWLSHRLRVLAEGLEDWSRKVEPKPGPFVGPCDQTTSMLLEESARMGKDIAKRQLNMRWMPNKPNIWPDGMGTSTILRSDEIKPSDWEVIRMGGQESPWPTLKPKSATKPAKRGHVTPSKEKRPQRPHRKRKRHPARKNKPIKVGGFHLDKNGCMVKN